MSSPEKTIVLVDFALNAHRDGQLVAFCGKRTRLTMTALQRRASPLLWCSSDVGPQALALRVRLWLLWGLAQIQPDDSTIPGRIDQRAWLGRTNWRPMIAVAAHFSLIEVPHFSGRNLGPSDSPAAERLAALWGIAPSSFYRYVDRGRLALANVLLEKPTPARMQSLLQFISESEHRALAQSGTTPIALRTGGPNPRAQAVATLVAPLWSAIQNDQINTVIELLSSKLAEFSSTPAIDVLLDKIDLAKHPEGSAVRVLQLRSQIARLQGDSERELAHLDVALPLAARTQDASLLALVVSMRARAFEPRDPERAMAYYRTAIDSMDTSSEATPPLLATCLIRLAWLYLQRKDPRATTLLERAESLLPNVVNDVAAQALFLQCRAELARRMGQRETAIEQNLQALQRYETIADTAQIRRIHGTLVLLYGERHDLANAILHARPIIDASGADRVEPHALAATHLNLGIAHFWSDDFDGAIEHYEKARAIASAAKIQTVVGSAHYNLAEAFFKRFQKTGSRDDEQAGSVHTALSLAVSERMGDQRTADATRKLKQSVLSDATEVNFDRLLPQELAIHFDDLSEIHSLRALQSHASNAIERARMALDICTAYLRIALKERDSALRESEYSHEHPIVRDRLRAINEMLHQNNAEDATLTTAWNQRAHAIVPAAALATLVSHLATHGAIKKSAYSTLCNVSLATASKHLGLLARAGLLKQQNKGPATQYIVVQ